MCRFRGFKRHLVRLLSFREFAKCRCCCKAKYCGKDCQSTAWSEGHRFWCSAKDPEDDGHHHHHHGERRTGAGTIGDGQAPAMMTTTSSGTITPIHLRNEHVSINSILYNSLPYHRSDFTSVDNIHVYFCVLNGVSLCHITHTLSNLCRP